MPPEGIPSESVNHQVPISPAEWFAGNPGKDA
jgi:hypothetical protein